MAERITYRWTEPKPQVRQDGILVIAQSTLKQENRRNRDYYGTLLLTVDVAQNLNSRGAWQILHDKKAPGMQVYISEGFDLRNIATVRIRVEAERPSKVLEGEELLAEVSRSITLTDVARAFVTAAEQEQERIAHEERVDLANRLGREVALEVKAEAERLIDYDKRREALETERDLEMLKVATARLAQLQGGEVWEDTRQPIDERLVVAVVRNWDKFLSAVRLPFAEARLGPEEVD